MFFVGIDIGGTFTDVVAFDESQPNNVQVVKVPTSPKQPEKNALKALQNYHDLASQVSLVAHATTIATNALLTRTGLAKTALITNEGFRDVLEIGRQRRAEIYDLKTRRPPPLVRRRDRFVVRGRISFNGSEIQPLDHEGLRRVSNQIKRESFEAVAIVFLNSYVNSKHEKLAQKFLRRTGFKGHIDISSEVDNHYREYERASTTVVNAALEPLIAKYLSRFSAELSRFGLDCPVYVMNSDGTSSTISQAVERPISVIESGPAAGVLSSKNLAKALGLEKVITFDMGGTTAKAGIIIDGQPDLSYEFEAAGKTHSGRSIRGSGYPVRYPFIDLAEVSSGGGTIAWVDEAGGLRAGPRSAGADPGPAAYGKGGTEPTVTDANIILGRVNPDHLLGGALKLHHELSVKSVQEKLARKLGTDPVEIAEGIIKIVQHNMARAIQLVTVERGRDPREFTLIGFGGAGPLHACELAEELGINRVIVPPHPGLFSALGLLTADLSRTFTMPIMRPVTSDLSRFFQKLKAAAEKSLKKEGHADYSIREFVDLRHQGQSFEITIPYRPNSDLSKSFREQHTRLYGYSSNDPVEAVNARTTVVVTTPKAKLAKLGNRPTSVRLLSQSSSRRAWVAEHYKDTPVLARDQFSPGLEGQGPCIIEEYDSTTVIPESWAWRIDGYGNIDLTLRH